MHIKETNQMARQSKIIIIAALILIITGSVYAAEATEIGKATIQTFSIEDSFPLATEAAAIIPDVNSAPITPKLQSSFTLPAFNLAPRKDFGDTLFTSSLVSLVALNVADFVSTRQALKLPGLAEGNPLMKPFVKNDLLFVGIKLGITALDLLFLKKVYKKNKVLGWALSIAANLAMSYIVSNNFRLIDQARGRI